MRILFITNFYQLYGANRSLLSIMEKFKEKGDELCLLLPKRGDFSEELDRRGIDYMVIPFFSQLFYYKLSKPYLIWPLLSIVTLLLLPYITYRVKKFNPQIIYSNTIADNIGIMIARILRKKHITHVRDFMNLDHGAKFLFGSKAKRKFLLLSDGVIYVSRSVAKHTLLSECLPSHHVVIYNGVKFSDSSCPDRCLPNPVNLGIVGLLDESKGQHMAIRYFKDVKEMLPCSILHIWGDKDSPYKKKLYKMVSEFGMTGRVIFHGFEKNPDVIYKDMDVLLMCSRMEGFGRVTIEAMGRGIPVMGFNAGGTSELVRNGYNGFLFASKEEFISGLKELFSSEEIYNMICQQAYNYSHKYYSESLYTSKVYAFVQSLMG